MKKIYYYKLIRDRIPEKIRRNGGQSKTRRLSKKDFERELLRKVEEEASALPRVRSHGAFVSELADVIDVLNEIKKVKKISAKEIRAAQRENFRRKGGFRKRLYLVWASDTGYRTNERRNVRRLGKH